MADNLPTTADRFVPDKHQGKLDPNFYCRGWNAKRKKYCRQPAGWGTDHNGTGRCKFHQGRPIESGRWSSIERPRIRDLYEQFAQDPDPLNLEHDLHLARALLRDFLERYDEWAEAFLAWHASYQNDESGPKKPRKVLDLADAVRIIDTISKVVERIEKIRSDSHISRKDLLRIIDAIAKILELRIQDDTLKEQIRHDLVDLRLA